MSLSTSKQIEGFVHCSRCLSEIPPGTSPEQWARLSFGFTKIGVQVWCVRHDINVINIDFEGRRHPANADF